MGGRTLVETYRVADRNWEVTTDSMELLAAARESFPAGLSEPGIAPDFRLHINVNDSSASGFWPRPVCRGRDHLAICCIGDESAILFDYRRRFATGSVTREVAEDARYWREIVFPFALGVMSPVLGAVPLHAACIRYRNRGVLIGARSGAGKSTLAAILARRGIEFISDDWVYLTAHDGLRVHALHVPIKLLPDATRFFPELESMAATESQNGEWSIAFDPVKTLGSRREYCCEPSVVILYDRVRSAELKVRGARTEDLLDWFSEPLDCVPPCLEIRRQEQSELIRKLSSCTCFVMTCDGTPDEIADNLLRVCDGKVPAKRPEGIENPSGIEHLDLLRRAEPAPHAQICDIGGVAAAIRANDAMALEQFPPGLADVPEFEVTIIVEAEPWPGLPASFRHQRDSLGYICLGREGLIAFDRDECEIAAFVTETAIRSGLVSQELRRLCGSLECTAVAIP